MPTEVVLSSLSVCISCRNVVALHVGYTGLPTVNAERAQPEVCRHAVTTGTMGLGSPPVRYDT